MCVDLSCLRSIPRWFICYSHIKMVLSNCGHFWHSTTPSLSQHSSAPDQFPMTAIGLEGKTWIKIACLQWSNWCNSPALQLTTVARLLELIYHLGSDISLLYLILGYITFFVCLVKLLLAQVFLIYTWDAMIGYDFHWYDGYDAIHVDVHVPQCMLVEAKHVHFWYYL